MLREVESYSEYDSKKKMEIVFNLRKNFVPKSLLVHYFSKKLGLSRVFKLPSIYERCYQCLWNKVILPINESLLDKSYLSFRPFRTSLDIYNIFKFFIKKKKYFFFSKAEFLPSFSKLWFLKNFPVEKKILRSWINHLSNYITLNCYDLLISESYISSTSIFQSLFTFTFNGLLRVNNLGTSRDKVIFIKSMIVNFLRNRGIKLDLDKFYFSNLYEGFDIMGFYFIRNKNNIYLGQISRDNVRSHKNRLKSIVKNYGNNDFFMLLRHLNKEILTWSTIYRSADLVWYIWGELDVYLYKILWKLVKRRHPRRPHTWIYLKYWKYINNIWVFFLFDYISGKSLLLESHSRLKSKDYKLPFFLNTFNIYNENKLKLVWFRKFYDHLDGIYKILWKKQSGLCPYCNRLIKYINFNSIKIQSWNTSSSYKKISTVNNIVLLHNYCSI
uniref:putative group II intron reverse transcriptase/maturase RoaA n=1 Tax=Phacus arnoldii TaxID=298292 RepID=UPI0023AA5EA9|nr:putative group II intron reverse transcriptase/maturase RoaA [Phacus arnoldii]WCH63588.1 putative group II intron reverse transcriptase/maturase RoaA [Phacus arnoldii]